MRFRNGTARQQALFGLLLSFYFCGLALTLVGQAQRVGQPMPGVILDGNHIMALRIDAVQAGLGSGGQVVAINGEPIEGKRSRGEVLPLLRRELGDTNVIQLVDRNGVLRDAAVPVLPWRWEDTLYATGHTMGIGAVFVLVSVVAFLIRPYEDGSWALLAMSVVAGGLFTCLNTQPFEEHTVPVLYFRMAVGLMSFVPLHGAVALIVVHPLLLHHRAKVLGVIYGLGITHGALQGIAWYTDWAGPLRHMGGIDRTTILISLILVFGRAAVLAVRGADSLVRQRARILLLGMGLGGIPLPAALFAHMAMNRPVIDQRLLYWTFTIFVATTAYTTVRHDLVNARTAVRRAVVYLGTLGILTAVALLLITVRPYAVALLLLSMLYYWPQFHARLDHWLYPRRAAFPDLLRSIGDDIAACGTTGEVLAALAAAPASLCETTSSVAFLFPDETNPNTYVAVAGRGPLDDADTLADEPLIQLMRTTRQQMRRDAVAVDAQFSNITDACAACFDRLGAVVLLPIERGGQVIGGLALGPRTADDVYEAPELQAVTTVTQQAVQALVRAEATAQLRAREQEFGDLKRFLSPQIIDQVMAKGGVAGLGTQRKLVTVVFCDLRGFTSFSDSVEPEEVLATLAEYHAAMGPRIEEFGGTLERFAGDGFMVFFNDPVDQPDHVQRAVDMALAMREDVAALRDRWALKGYTIDAGIGIHTGYATCGFVGYEGRRDYAVIGNVTNLAARLSDAAGGGEVFITAGVRAALGRDLHVESVGALPLKGFHKPQAVFRVTTAPAEA